jgi:hypothetical protein
MASILRGLVRIAETIAGVLDIGISARRTRLSRPANGQLVILAVWIATHDETANRPTVKVLPDLTRRKWRVSLYDVPSGSTSARTCLRDFEAGHRS